jgi:ATP adenylyltransferase/5',5'''-P-1,P-4-tetraphosphate phosphorylase II
MLSQTISSRFSQSSALPLARLVQQLYQEQIQSWPMLAEGVNALGTVQTREIPLDGTSVFVQFNPNRIVSTGAKVDPASIKERKCFLCVPHLPAEQRGVLYDEKFLVLCNPMPIFREHFTVSHVEHIPQSIEEQILPMLNLAKDLDETHTVFYNGPKCGASAPDHMHFQVSPAGAIPVERESVDPKIRSTVRTIASVSVSTLDRYHRAVIVLEGKMLQEMELTFLRLTAAMRKTMKAADEPMMNVLCSYRDGAWRMIIFPRAKHRPDVYHLEGNEKVLISPAAVDIGGLVITPAQKDFLTVDGPAIGKIFHEVSVDDEILHSIIRSM